jgi:hypothetical protein
MSRRSDGRLSLVRLLVSPLHNRSSTESGNQRAITACRSRAISGSGQFYSITSSAATSRDCGTVKPSGVTHATAQHMMVRNVIERDQAATRFVLTGQGRAVLSALPAKKEPRVSGAKSGRKLLRRETAVD